MCINGMVMAAKAEKKSCPLLTGIWLKTSIDSVFDHETNQEEGENS